MERTPPHDYGSNLEEMREWKNKLRRGTLAAEQRWQQRRGKQQEYAMSQKDKHDCMQYETKKETILTLRQQNMEMNTALGDEQFKKKRILLAEKQ